MTHDRRDAACGHDTCLPHRLPYTLAAPHPAPMPREQRQDAVDDLLRHVNLADAPQRTPGRHGLDLEHLGAAVGPAHEVDAAMVRRPLRRGGGKRSGLQRTLRGKQWGQPAQQLAALRSAAMSTLGPKLDT